MQNLTPRSTPPLHPLGGRIRGPSRPAAILAFAAVATLNMHSSSAWGQDIQRASVSTAGVQANNRNSEACISANGRYVAYRSYSNTLVPCSIIHPTIIGYGNDILSDILVRDLQTGITELVSVANVGAHSNSTSLHPSISADGRYVVFASQASNLLSQPIIPLIYHIYVRDRVARTTRLVSRSTAGSPGNKNSFDPVISANGRYIVFRSAATNLDQMDRDGDGFYFYAYVHDLVTGTTERVINTSISGVEPGGGVSRCSISADGRYVAFDAVDYVSVPWLQRTTTGVRNIYIHDRQLRITECINSIPYVSIDYPHCEFTSISADGRHVAFYCFNTNLVPGKKGIFVWDRLRRGIEWIRDVNVVNDNWSVLSLSADGRHIAYHWGLQQATGGRWSDIYVFDRLTRTEIRASVSFDGSINNSNSILHSFWNGSQGLSADGRYVAFTSYATNLVPGDTNRFSDIFVSRLPLPDVDPPDTWIVSAINGRGVPILNGGYSTSNSVTFTLRGTDDTGVTGFQGVMDGTAFVPCPNPAPYGNLTKTKHGFQARAVDTVGNVDPTPAQFSWTIIDPITLEQLTAKVKTTKGIVSTARAKLLARLKLADQSYKRRQNGMGNNVMFFFIQDCLAWAGNAVPKDDAYRFIAWARAIIADHPAP